MRSQRRCYLVITLLASIRPYGYEWRPEVQGGIPATMLVLGIVKPATAYSSNPLTSSPEVRVMLPAARVMLEL